MVRNIMRNASDIFASLVEAVRKGQVALCEILPEIPKVPSDLPLLKKRDFDWSIPVLDFGNLIAHDVHRNEEAIRCGYKLLASDQLPLPFDVCVLMYLERFEGTHKLITTAFNVECVVRLEQDGNKIVAEIFGREVDSKGMVVRYPVRGRRTVEWVMAAAKLQISSTDVVLAFPTAGEGGSLVSDMDSRWARDQADQIVACLYLLTIRGTTRENAMPTNFTQAVNQGRLGAGKDALRPVTTIRIGAGRSEKLGHDAISMGSIKRPHLRRAHTRRLQNGQNIDIRSTKIHGGPADDLMPFYVVKP